MTAGTGTTSSVRRTRATVRKPPASASPPPADPAEWAAYFTQAADQFLAVAETVDLDAPTWGLLGPQPGRDWLRHVGQETTVHRWDIEHELGLASHLPTERAVEALDDTVTYSLLLASDMGCSVAVSAADRRAHRRVDPLDRKSCRRRDRVRRDLSAWRWRYPARPVAELLLHLHGRMAWHPTLTPILRPLSEWQA